MRLKILSANVLSTWRAASCALLGDEGLELELLDEGLEADAGCFDADFEMDLLLVDLVVDFLAELLGFFLLGLADLTGVFMSDSARAPEKLNSLIGDTEDLLLTLFEVDFLAEDLALDRLPLLLAEVVGFFLIDDGVFLAEAPAAFGLGVLLIGFEALLAGVAVCLAIFLINRIY